jgi:hypothetical protein
MAERFVPVPQLRLAYKSLLLLFLISPLVCSAQFQGVLTIHNDNARTGQNLNETILTPTNVANTARFGKLGSYPVLGQIYAQPLYVARGVAGLTRNMLYVVTEQDMLYAFDADHVGNGPVFTRNLVPTGQSWKSCMTKNCTVCPDVGVTGTPVIDPVSGTMYLLARTVDSTVNPPVYYQTIHALDITTGSDKVSANIPRDVDFDPRLEGQRAGLLLSQGKLYIAWWSEGVGGHGIMKVFDVNTLLQTSQFVPGPTEGATTGTGIWMSGAGIVADAAGNVFLETADGPYDGISTWGDTVVKLDCSSTTCIVTDSFTPHNQSQMYDDDIDLGAAGPALISSSCTNGCAHPNEVLAGGKNGDLYMLDQDSLGGYNPSDMIVQTVGGSLKNLYYGSPAYWSDSTGTEYIYFGACNTNLKMYTLSPATGLLKLADSSPNSFGFPGPTPSVSANGSSNGILWATERTEQGSYSCTPTTAGVLHAYDATDVSTELYNTQMCPTRDQLGPATKFAVPTVANGKVFVGASSEVDVFGLYSKATTCQ